MESTTSPRRPTDQAEKAVPAYLWHSYVSHVFGGTPASIAMAQHEIVTHLESTVDAIPGTSNPGRVAATEQALSQAWINLDYITRAGLTATSGMARRSVVRRIVSYLDALAGR